MDPKSASSIFHRAASCSGATRSYLPTPSSWSRSRPRTARRSYRHVSSDRARWCREASSGTRSGVDSDARWNSQRVFRTSVPAALRQPGSSISDDRPRRGRLLAGARSAHEGSLVIFHEPQLWWYPERPTRPEPILPQCPEGNLPALASPPRGNRATAPAGCSTQRRAHGSEALTADSLA